jgi:hypothetical protein
MGAINPTNMLPPNNLECFEYFGPASNGGIGGNRGLYGGQIDSEIECDTERELLQQYVARVISVVADRIELSCSAEAHGA